MNGRFHASWIAAGLLLAGQFLTSMAAAAEYPPPVGSRHPDFTLPTIDDRRPVSLSDFRGRKVLLIQFASW